MEGAQSQDATVTTDAVTDETAVLTALFHTFGGILIIAMFSSILMGVALVFQWVEGRFLGVIVLSSISIGPGVIVLFFAVVLRVRMDKMYDALVRGAGVILLFYPPIVVRATPYWLPYFIIGLLLLAQPRMRQSNRLRGNPHSVLTALGFCLGLLTAALTLFLMSEAVISRTFYSIPLLTTSLVLVVFAVMYAIHPRGSEIKRSALA